MQLAGESLAGAKESGARASFRAMRGTVAEKSRGFAERGVQEKQGGAKKEEGMVFLTKPKLE